MKNKYEINGDIAGILLRRMDGSFIKTIIDASDLPRAMEFSGTWYAKFNNYTKTFYVWGNLGKGKERSTIHLHRWVMDCPRELEVDHRNHDTLNNTRVNLRNVTRLINRQNLRTRIDNSSGFRNVSWSKANNKWEVHMMVSGESIHIGLFKELNQAVEASLHARAKYMPGNTEKEKVC